MNAKIKHSKIKNTGILFELLTRQITADVLNDKDGKAVTMLKTYFSPGMELGKEYELYKVLTTEKYKSKSKANHLVSAVLSASTKINKNQLRREKYNLISEIRSSYNIDDFFMARILNYKMYASIYKLFESTRVTDPTQETESRYIIIENIVKTVDIAKKRDVGVIQNYKKQEKDLRLLAYSILVEKFNKKYKVLNESQKSLLGKYIYNISNTNSLKEYIETEIGKVKKELKSHLPKVDDKITKIKLNEAINQADTIMKGRIVKDKQVVALMRYYELVKELKNV
tara:strand:+ start:2177 stop:3028 length:852 start_codon:yes stop_codon:yes gene_type:complete